MSKDNFEVGIVTGEKVFLTLNGMENAHFSPTKARLLAQQLTTCANLVDQNEEEERRIDPREYPVEIYLVADEDGEEHDYYIAFCPDFGFSTCSGPGDTEQEALENFRRNLVEIMEYFKEKGKDLPIPSYHDFDTGRVVKGERPELKKRREDVS